MNNTAEQHTTYSWLINFKTLPLPSFSRTKKKKREREKNRKNENSQQITRVTATVFSNLAKISKRPVQIIGAQQPNNNPALSLCKQCRNYSSCSLKIWMATGYSRPRPHKSPDKTIIISKEGKRERERVKGRGSVAETGTIFPGNSCQVRKLGYKLHNEPTPNRLLFRGDQSENSEACRDNISLITVEETSLWKFNYADL